MNRTNDDCTASAAYGATAAITVVSAYISLGYATVALRALTGDGDAAAMYAFSRSVALATTSTVALFVHWPD